MVNRAPGRSLLIPGEHRYQFYLLQLLTVAHFVHTAKFAESQISFVEKRLNTRSKRHLKAHSLVAYRSGLTAVDRAGRALMDQALRRRRVNQLTSLRLDDDLAHALLPVDHMPSIDLTPSDDIRPTLPPGTSDPEAALERSSERDSEPGIAVAEEAETYMQSGFFASTMRTISRLYQPSEDL